MHDFGEIVDYPMIFPVADGAAYTYYWDTFWAPRSGGVHHAQDIMAPKMTPVVAPVDGTVHWVNWSSNPNDLNPERCCNLTIDHDDGWESWYIHLNNDTPGTDDGKAWGIAPGILPGTPVKAGQLIGWVGDSGNAENTGPHLHFELLDPEGVRVNPIRALDDAPRINLDGTCEGETVTVPGTTGNDVLEGTPGPDVIHGRGGDDLIDGKGGDDIICGGKGNDTIIGGAGADLIKGNAGDDTIEGGTGRDTLLGSEGNDKLLGGSDDDRLYGKKHKDVLKGNDGDDLIVGGSGRDRLFPGKGDDEAYGNGGKDRFIAGPGTNEIWGGPGADTVTYRDADVGVAADLAAGTAMAEGSDALHAIERLAGTVFADLISGDDLGNVLRGGDGDDTLDGRGGNDKLIGGGGTNEVIGGDGDDWCSGGDPLDCEDGPA
jgi:Ca2+-binding RTX toxin-like protein